VEHFIRTQREDRTGTPRDALRQDALVSHRLHINAQGLINMSRKRLCNQAHKETRQAWLEALETLYDVEPELVAACVPECLYRGFCPEIKTCGYKKTEEYREALVGYRLPAL
jgi:thymidylate synthase ThyX